MQSSQIAYITLEKWPWAEKPWEKRPWEKQPPEVEAAPDAVK